MADTLTLGEQLAAEWRTRGRLHPGDQPSIEVEYRALIDSDTAFTEGNAGLLVGNEVVVGPGSAQRTYLGDVVPGGPPAAKSGGQTLYVVEHTPATDETGATGVDEGEVKPEQVLEWRGDTQKLRKIPAWVPATSEIMEDAGALDVLIRGALTHRVRFRFEAELIAGTDTATSLLGVINTPEVATTSAAGAADGVLAALEASEEVALGPARTWVIVSPARYWECIDEVPGFWRDVDQAGIGVIRTKGIPDTKVVAGPFSTGAAKRATTITIRTSDSHSDWFAENKLAVVAELRASSRLVTPYAFAVNTGNLSG